MLYSLRNIQRKYNNRIVLDIPFLDIEQGKIYTLLGPNGAGKTTLLNILALLERPTHGELAFLGDQICWDKHIFLKRRQVVLLDQSPIMFSGTVYDNVAYGLKVRKVGRSEINQRVKAALETVGMERFSEANARGLSGGETKRVSLARAMVLEPLVLLCDEPTANVDKENQEIILNLLFQMREKNETSIIFSTHYHQQSSRLSERTLVLQNGRLSVALQENMLNVQCLIKNPGELHCRVRENSHERDGGKAESWLEFCLPLSLFPYQAEQCFIQIDATLLALYSCSEERQGEGLQFSGRVWSLQRDGEFVSIQVDVGVVLSLRVSLSHYLEKGYTLGQNVMVDVPFRALSLSPVA